MSQSIQARNKALVLEAFDTLFNKRDYAAAEKFWSPHYIQHSAHIQPGREGLFNSSISTTRFYDKRKMRAEDSPTFRIKYQAKTVFLLSELLRFETKIRCAEIVNGPESGRLLVFGHNKETNLLSDMRAIHWLHISDIHLRARDAWSQDVVLKARPAARGRRGTRFHPCKRRSGLLGHCAFFLPFWGLPPKVVVADDQKTNPTPARHIARASGCF